ncbi:glycerophosphodiester phosphodiesterase family protein [Streptomyces sp. NPDC048489]|uniref:glycerophosphodiester phosphodiesterase family protein n=1 Tax=Streptomyces sp. NPDC048489 TaxID=3154504 RepID=UPI00341EDCFA
MPAQESLNDSARLQHTNISHSARQMVTAAEALRKSLPSWPSVRSPSDLNVLGTAQVGKRQWVQGWIPPAAEQARQAIPQRQPRAKGQSPFLIAHRGGTADHPENTLLAVEQSLKVGADGVWLSVQATQDGVPVLYRPVDLKDLTDGSGAVADKTLKELAGLNAGYHFTGNNGTYPYRQPDKSVRIPTLEEALNAIPKGKQIYLDLKQAPAAHVVKAVSDLLSERKLWERVLLYSTDAETTRLLTEQHKAQVAESRDATRQRLAEYALGGACKSAPSGQWVAFERKRFVKMVEDFTLGAGVSPVMAELWTKGSVACFTKERPELPIVMLGINTQEDLSAATQMGAYAVLIDSPKKMIPQSENFGSSPPTLRGQFITAGSSSNQIHKMASMHPSGNRNFASLATVTALPQRGHSASSAGQSRKY